jgi:hypothetical protein
MRSIREAGNWIGFVPAAGHAALLRAAAGRRHGGGKDKQRKNNMDAFGAGVFHSKKV